MASSVRGEGRGLETGPREPRQIREEATVAVRSGLRGTPALSLTLGLLLACGPPKVPARPSGAPAALACAEDTREVLRSGHEQWCERDDGSRHGPYQEWGPGLVLLVKGAFHDGRRAGTWTEWHPNGALKSEGSYGGIGLRSGRWAWWYDDGKPQAEGAYDGGREHGAWVWWYPNGARERAGVYVLGIEDGPWTTWHPNGQVASQGSWIDGEQAGDWQWWDAMGAPASAD